MKEKAAYAVVILIGVGLLGWLALATRYQYYYSDVPDVTFRDDGWTRTRQLLHCEYRPIGMSTPTAGNQAHVNPPLSPSELDRLNRSRQERHLPKVDAWGHELTRICQWVTE